jgi:hypothetical protein
MTYSSNTVFGLITDQGKSYMSEKSPMRPTVQEVADVVRAYLSQPGSCAGGNFHLVLANRNVDDAHVHFCIEQATAAGDAPGVELGQLLLQMTKTQRLKLTYVS